MKPNNVTLLPIPVMAERRSAYPVNMGQLGELSQALRKDTMAEYVKTHPPR